MNPLKKAVAEIRATTSSRPCQNCKMYGITPIVHGAFSSILGPDYYLHLHRHVHESRPGSDARIMHKDSLHNSRYCADQNRRHHHCRWMMAMYYPQDTPREMGPTSVTPRSQYITAREQEGEHLFSSGPAGTVVLIHYDILHKKEANYTDITRHMVKFLFTRMDRADRTHMGSQRRDLGRIR